MSLLIYEFQIPTFYFLKFNRLGFLLPETCYLSENFLTDFLSSFQLSPQHFPGFSHASQVSLPQGCTVRRDRAMREENNTKAAAQHRQNLRAEGAGKSLCQVVRKDFWHEVKAFTFWTY